MHDEKFLNFHEHMCFMRCQSTLRCFTHFSYYWKIIRFTRSYLAWKHRGKLSVSSLNDQWRSLVDRKILSRKFWKVHESARISPTGCMHTCSLRSVTAIRDGHDGRRKTRTCVLGAICWLASPRRADEVNRPRDKGWRLTSAVIRWCGSATMVIEHDNEQPDVPAEMRRRNAGFIVATFSRHDSSTPRREFLTMQRVAAVTRLRQPPRRMPRDCVSHWVLLEFRRAAIGWVVIWLVRYTARYIR